MPRFQLTVGLDKSRRCVRDVLEMMNCTNCRTSLFFNKYAHEHTFSVYWVRETILRNKTYIYLWSVCQILKINNEICFMSHLTILKLIIVSKINLQWNCLPTFPYPPSQTTSAGKALDGEAKFQTPEIFWLFRILQIRCFVFVKINLLLQLQAYRNMPAYFDKL